MEKVETLVIGGALSGLMAGYLLKRNYLVLEAVPQMNFNLQAPFFLHAPIDWLPTRWKQIDVVQNVWDGKDFRREPTIKDMVDYSKKISDGKIINTSLLFMDGARQVGFLPASGSAGDILKDLYQDIKQNVWEGVKISSIDVKNKVALASRIDGAQGYTIQYENIISTIPLPALLKMVGWEFPAAFSSSPIQISAYQIPDGCVSEAYQIAYLTNKAYEPHKLALMHNMVFAESSFKMEDSETRRVVDLIWGLQGLQMIGEREIKPGKFHPIETSKRKGVLGRLTAQHSIYSLGRYATWSYKRIDHVAEDAKQIVNIIHSKEL